MAVSTVKLNGTTLMTVNDSTATAAGVSDEQYFYAANGVRTQGALDLDSYAPLASPAFTGTPTAPTATAGTNTTQIATTAFVHTDLANAVATEIISVALGSKTGTGSSVTWSKSNAAITANHEVLSYSLSAPTALLGNLTWTTSAGAISVSGNISGTTTLTVILGAVGTSVT